MRDGRKVTKVEMKVVWRGSTLRKFASGVEKPNQK